VVASLRELSVAVVESNKNSQTNDGKIVGTLNVLLAFDKISNWLGHTLCSEKKTPTHIFFHISMSDV